MFERLLKKIAIQLKKGAIPYMVIGGQAVLLYGEPRLTRDIDITLGMGVNGLDKIFRKPITVTFDCFVEAKSRNPIQGGQIPIQNNSLTADCYNQGRYVISGVCYHFPLHLQPSLI